MENHLIAILVVGILFIIILVVFILIYSASKNSNSDEEVIIDEVIIDEEVIIDDNTYYPPPSVTSVLTNMEGTLDDNYSSGKMIAEFVINGSSFTSKSSLKLDSGDIPSLIKISSTQIFFSLSYPYPRYFNTSISVITEYGTSSKIPFVFKEPTISKVSVSKNVVTITGTNFYKAVSVQNKEYISNGITYSGTTSISYTDEKYNFVMPFMVYSAFGYYTYYV